MKNVKGMSVLVFAVFLVSVVALTGGQRAEAADPVTLEFVVWNYSLETIQDNIKQFEAANPDIKVNLTDYSWPMYHDTLVLRLKGKTQTDILYSGEDWLPEWAAAGWVAPLEDYFRKQRSTRTRPPSTLWQT